MARVLVVSSDIVGERMAGPGIRAWEISRALAREHDVTLAAPPPAPRGEAGVRVVEATKSRLDAEATRCDVAVIQGSLTELSSTLRTGPALVVDLYDPYPIEGLEFHHDQGPSERQQLVDRDVERLEQQLFAGDFFLCASEKQRPFWMGALMMAGRLDVEAYDFDAELRQLLAVVPFGVPDTPPQPSGARLRGAIDGIGPDDFVLVWGGGIWNWLDPVTLLRAVAEVAAESLPVRLVFLGTTHPNPAVPRMRMAVEARRLAEQLDLLDRHVFFLGDWLPYRERGAVLLECDLGVSLHRRGLESELAFRTRVLDYLWAGLPVVLTEGDAISDMVTGGGAGVSVPAQDVSALAEVIRHYAQDRNRLRESRGASRALAGQMTWSSVVAPLNEYCHQPRRTARPHASRGLRTTGPSGPSLATRAQRVLRREGFGALVRRTYRYLRSRR